MVLTISIDDLMEDQMLQYWEIVLNSIDRAFIHTRVYMLFYMIASVTLGFMHFAFVRVKILKKRSINMVNFLFEKWGLFVCMCA